MKNLKILLSLIEYLKTYVPFVKNNICDRGIEAYAFLRLYQKLGGKVNEVGNKIYLDKSFEITLRLLNGEKVILKEKKQKQKVVGGSVYMLHSREHIISGLSAAIMLRDIDRIYKEPYPGYFDNVNYKNKKRTGSKIPKQNKKRRR